MAPEPFLLSDDTEHITEVSEWARDLYGADVDMVFRHLVSHTNPGHRPCVMVLAGANAAFPVEIDATSTGFISFGAGLAEISADGLDIEVVFRNADTGAETSLFSAYLPRFDADTPWFEHEIDLSAVGTARGSLVVVCGPGPEADCSADWLAIYELIVCPADELTLYRARAFPKHRTEVELAVFTHAYQHELYTAETAEEETVENAEITEPATAAPPTQTMVEPPEEAPIAEADPPLDNLTVYYTKRLWEELKLTPCDFRGPLEARIASLDRPVRILSLASGAARIEESFVDGLDPSAVELTLTDLNPELLETARARLAGKAQIDLMTVNLNSLELPENRYDIVMCVSALHHVVELERVIAGIAKSLVDGGEFWSVGEYIGRTGSRLHELDYQIANGFFQSLAPRYRVDNFSTTGHVDTKLSNADCSATCYEGIRSEEVEPIIGEHFDLIESTRHDCFAWRLFSQSYWKNFDLGVPDDRSVVERAIKLDANLQRHGGHPASLSGRYVVRG